MKKTLIALAAASSLSLGACSTTSNDTLADAATGAAVGGLGGAAVGAVVPGVSPITGAAVGAAIGGLTGAVWADNNNDGYADGYVQNGQYYQGQPSGWDSTLGRVATGAGVGAVAGAVGGALEGVPSVPISAHHGTYYLRLMVVDRPGVIADVTAALRDAGVSLESMLQHGRAPGEAVPVVLVTHETDEVAMRSALDRIGAMDAVLEPPALIRIEPA